MQAIISAEVRGLCEVPRGPGRRMIKVELGPSTTPTATNIASTSVAPSSPTPFPLSSLVQLYDHAMSLKEDPVLSQFLVPSVLEDLDESDRPATPSTPRQYRRAPLVISASFELTESVAWQLEDRKRKREAGELDEEDDLGIWSSTLKRKRILEPGLWNARDLTNLDSDCDHGPSEPNGQSQWGPGFEDSAVFSPPLDTLAPSELSGPDLHFDHGDEETQGCSSTSHDNDDDVGAFSAPDGGEPIQAAGPRRTTPTYPNYDVLPRLPDKAKDKRKKYYTDLQPYVVFPGDIQVVPCIVVGCPQLLDLGNLAKSMNHLRSHHPIKSNKARQLCVVQGCGKEQFYNPLVTAHYFNGHLGLICECPDVEGCGGTEIRADEFWKKHMACIERVRERQLAARAAN